MPAGSSILRYRRALLERWIEDAIALLDLIDGDADFEPELADSRSDREFDDAEFDLPGVVLGGQGI